MKREFVGPSIVAAGALIVVAAAAIFRLRDEAPAPAPPALVDRLDLPRTAEAGRAVEELRAELNQLREENARLWLAIDDLRRPETPAPRALPPSVSDPDVTDLLGAREDKAALRHGLGKLLDVKDHLDPAVYRHALLEHVAGHLELSDPTRTEFINAGLQIGAELARADQRYGDTIRSAYRQAGRDWTKVEIPDEARAQWDAAKMAAEDRLRVFLDLRVPRHQVFEKEELSLFVRSYLSTSGFSWE